MPKARRVTATGSNALPRTLKTRIALAVSALFILASGVIALWALTLFEAEKKRSLADSSFRVVSSIADPEKDAQLS
jgi:hypothetical protein